MELFYRELFEYNHLTNQKLLTVFNLHSDKVSEKSVKWMNHILDAHHIWNHRMCKKIPAYSVWQIHSLGYLKEIDVLNYETSLTILAAGEFEQKLDYTSSQGKTYTNSVKDVLFHVINHSTYHRGQIASDIKQSGIEPPVTDFIAFKR